MTPDQLRSFLAAQEWTADNLADLVGAHRSTVFRWLNGEQPIPRYVSVICTAWPHVPRRVKEALY
jgi:transcriptional regulator with XRE-family HTH domain